MGVDGIINSFNQFTYTAAAVQGAAEQLAPAAYAVNNSINQIASVFTGDTYQQTNPYPVQPYPLTTGNTIKAGLIGNLLAGGAAGAMTHQQTADAFRTFKGTGMGAGFKALGMSSLKAGGIGAAVTGIISGVKNFSAASRNEISKADAGGNVVADTVGGLLAGAGGGLAAGAANMALSSFGAVGLPLTIGAAVAGALGATGVGLLFESSGARDGLAGTMRKAFGGTDPAPVTQGYGYPPAGYNYGY